ncbi:MAG: flavin reductase family protein, partial [Ilumatobacteraceae bacterium]
MTTKQRFRVDELEGVDAYKLATGLIVPRPIGWIGTLSADGVPNVAPYSFFNVVSGLPPTFVFSPGRGGRKDTLDNVRAVGEFTVNVVTAEVAEAMNASSASFPPDVDEFEACGLTAVPSRS